MFSGDVFFVACFRKLGCGLLFAFHSNARLGFSARLGFFYKNALYKLLLLLSFIVCERQRVIGRKLQKKINPHLYLAPPQG